MSEQGRPRPAPPGWCRSDGGREVATYQSGDNTASLLFRCQIFNGPHTSLRIESNAITDNNRAFEASRSPEARLAYGLDAFGGHGLSTPYAGLAVYAAQPEHEMFQTGL